MFVAIVSDIHDELHQLEKAIFQAQSYPCSHLICLGDLVELSTLRKLCDLWPLGIDIVFGNNETDHEKHLLYARQRANIRHHGMCGDFLLGNRRILMAHRKEDAMQAMKPDLYDALFFGHTHMPDRAFYGKTLIANPGEVGGYRYPARFAVYDTDANSLQHYQI